MNTVNFVSIPASIVPEQEILVFGNERLTYTALNDLIARLSSTFHQLGLQQRDVIAVLDTNSHLYVASYYAAAKAGLTFLPLNYRAKDPELEYMINTAKAKLLLTGDRYIDLINRIAGKLRTTRLVAIGQGDGQMPLLSVLLASAEPDESEAEVEDEDVSVLMYTSGTTSLPKGVMLSFRDFTAYVTANVEMADGSERGVFLVCAPFYHIAGTTAMMTNLWTGRKMIVMPQFDPKSWLELVQQESSYARVHRPHDDEAGARRAGFRDYRLLVVDQPCVRWRTDADCGHPARDRGFSQTRRLRQRLRSDRNHLLINRAWSRRPSYPGLARRRSS